MTACIVGIDVGTSSVKAAYVSLKGRLLHSESVTLMSNVQQGAYSTQDPYEWLAAIDHCLAMATTYEILGMGICVNCSTLVPSSCVGWTPIDRAWLWNDTRASGSANAIEAVLCAGGIQRKVYSSEPSARLLSWSEGALASSRDLRFCEAATWIMFRLTGNSVLPSSIFDGRWGLLADSAARTLLFDKFPAVESVYRKSMVPLVGWKDCVGQVALPSTSSGQPMRIVPLFSSGNDGLTAIVGSGHLTVPNTEYLILGTSRLHISSANEMQNGNLPDSDFIEWLPKVDILFDRAFILHHCDKSSDRAFASRSRGVKSKQAADQTRTLCLLGGGAEKFRLDWTPFGKLVRCGLFAGAVGAAAFAGMALGVLPRNIERTSNLIRENWMAI
jgi:ribulose kinase